MQLNIGPYSLTISAPYAAGQRLLTAAEASVLNTARLALIKDKAARALRNAQTAAGETLLPDGDYARWCMMVERLDHEFSFSAPPRGSSEPRPGTVNWEIRELASELVDLEAEARGTGWTSGGREAAIAARGEQEDVRATARARWEAKQQANADLLAILNGE